MTVVPTSCRSTAGVRLMGRIRMFEKFSWSDFPTHFEIKYDRYLVSPWQYRGTALDYVRTHRDVNYKNLVPY
jgi:hypothetical protein